MELATVLIVDDSPTELRVMEKALRDRGYTTTTAEDGEQALEKAGKERPRVIVLDVILPKKNGFQVCRDLKASAETRDIPVIMVTSKVQDSDRFWGLKQGADEYITKPFSDEALAEAVAKHFPR
jgi:DNA-binding response OmpR family regulator